MSTKHGGMVPFHINDEGEIMYLLMTPTSDNQPRIPQISKGKREDGESAKKTARRESEEELGLTKSLMRTKPEKLGKFDDDKVWMVEVRDPSKFKTRDKDEVSSIEWMNLRDFKKKGWQEQLPILRAAQKKILDMP